jgi:hypothetical protein
MREHPAKGEAVQFSTAWTQIDFLERIERLGLAEEHRPAPYRSYTATIGKRQYEIASTGWDVAEGRACARSARIVGPAMDISTVMLYPTRSPDRLPVFAAEWVVFGPRIHTLVLDVEVCGEQPSLFEDCRAAFSRVHRVWKDEFPVNRDKPDWFKEIETPWALYGEADIKQMERLRQAFAHYLDVTMDSFYSPRLDESEAGDDHAAVQAYKHHHYVNSPGHRILGVKFGEQHTDRLLKDWHFGPNRRSTVVA